MNKTIENLYKKSVNELFSIKSKSNNHYDLVIIGAGFSGLEVGVLVGRKSKNKDKNILILEQSNYIGGRIRTETETYKGKHFQYEAGGARFNKNHKALFSVINRYKLESKLFKIPSYWEFKPTKNYKQNLNNIPFNNIEELLAILIDYYDNPKFKPYLSHTTLYDACKDLFGLKIAQYLQSSYSYYSEIKVFNAFNAIKSLKHDLSETNQFYCMNGGYSQIATHLAQDYLDSVNKQQAKFNSNRLLSLKTQVKSWSYNSESRKFKIKIVGLETGDSKTITCDNLVLAVDGKVIQSWRRQLCQISPKISSVISAVSPQPLLRTYAIYDSKWFKNYGKIVTDGLVKFIIPIDYKLGLIMISYTDGEYVKKMMRYIEDGTQEDAIYTSLKEIFPNDKIENKPAFLRNEYWETGAVYWNKKANSKQMSELMLQPSKKHNLYICGDSFSENQAWTDGALSTAQKVAKLIKL